MVRAPTPKSRRKALRQMAEEDPEFQIAPMIDVLLVLLVFFMSISTTEALQSTQGINLPVAKEGAPPGEAPGQVVINLKWNSTTQEGTIIINEENYEVRQIAQLLERAQQRNPMMRVLVRADQATKYEFVRQVMVSIANAKISNVTFSAVDKQIEGLATE